MRYSPPVYEPPPEVIAAACAQFQRDWSPHERYCRRVALADSIRQARAPVDPTGWQPPTIHVTPDVAAALEAM